MKNKTTVTGGFSRTKHEEEVKKNRAEGLQPDLEKGGWVITKVTSSLLDTAQTVTIQGRVISTREAVITWHQMTTLERSKYQGMTDRAIVQAIYSDPAMGFNYLRQRNSK